MRGTRQSQIYVLKLFRHSEWKAKANGNKLEFAHFTVKEFLQQIDHKRDISIGAYRIESDRDELIRAKVCFTYLNFEDFEHGGPFSCDVSDRRFVEYPFRRYAVFASVSESGKVAHSSLDDPELFSLMQKLFSPSKPNTLILWMHDWVADFLDFPPSDKESLCILNSGFAETTALHWAAMLGLVKVCSWLIRSGCDVNRKTSFGTPLHCAIFNTAALYWSLASHLEKRKGLTASDEAVDLLLLEAGADPNCYHSAGRDEFSPLFAALTMGHWDLAERLLDKGGTLDSNCLDLLENHEESDDIYKIVEHTNKHNLSQENNSRLLELALRAKTSNATRLMHKDDDLPIQNSHCEQILRNAAGHGQLDIVRRLLEDQKLDIDAADESTGLTALHFAAQRDQFAVVQFLMNRGAVWTKSDRLGRTAVHHAVQGKEARCLEFLLHRNADTGLRDLEGMTV